MAKERRTDITSSTPGKITTRREPAVERGTERLQAVGRTTKKMTAVGTGRTTSMRPVTGKAGAIGSGTRKTTSVNSVTGGYKRTKKFPFDKIIVCLILAVGGYFVWGYYADKNSQEQRERELRQAEFQRQEQEKLKKQQEEAEAKRKLEAEEAAKKRAEEDKMLAEIEARKKAAAEAEAARKLELEQAEQKRAAEATARQEAAARAQKALAKLREAEAAALKDCQEGKFAEGATRMKDAINEAVVDLKNGEEKPFVRTQKTAQMFAELMEQTRPLPETSAKNMFVFTLKDGSKVRGKVESELGNEIALTGSGGVRALINKERVASRKEITQQEVDAELQKALDDKAAAAGSGVDWFLTGILALESNRPEQGAKAFNKSLELDRDIAQNVREHRARLLLASGIFNRSIRNERIAKERLDRLVNEYGDTKAAKMYLQSQTQEDAIVAEVAKKETGSGEAKEIREDLDKARSELKNPTMAKADELVQQARALEEKAQSASNRKLSNELYKEAVTKLSTALAMYQELQNDKRTDKNVLDQKMSDAARKLYWCRKLQTL